LKERRRYPTRFDLAPGARGSRSRSFDVNFIMGTIGECGSTREGWLSLDEHQRS
jgi:hypothetical protein